MVIEKASEGKIHPEPYWLFDALEKKARPKLRNSFYLSAKVQIVDNKEQFLYDRLLMLQKFSFDRFLEAVEKGKILVDFDAKTTHNHGTKFRIRQDSWPELYKDVETIF